VLNTCIVLGGLLRFAETLKLNTMATSTEKFKAAYGSVDIHCLINYKAMLVRKAKRTGESFADYIKEFYSK
jgi:hypothetical protein